MTTNLSLQPQGVRLEVRGVDKRYGTRDVLKKTELVIEPGQFVAIVGRSGCGKSTLLRLVAGLEPVSGGAIRLDGQDVAGLSGDTRIMFQDSRLLPWKRVQDNVALGLPPAQRGAAADVLARVGLGDRLGEWPARLSGARVHMATPRLPPSRNASSTGCCKSPRGSLRTRFPGPACLRMACAGRSDFSLSLSLFVCLFFFH